MAGWTGLDKSQNSSLSWSPLAAAWQCFSFEEQKVNTPFGGDKVQVKEWACVWAILAKKEKRREKVKSFKLRRCFIETMCMLVRHLSSKTPYQSLWLCNALRSTWVTCCWPTSVNIARADIQMRWRHTPEQSLGVKAIRVPTLRLGDLHVS